MPVYDGSHEVRRSALGPFSGAHRESAPTRRNQSSNRGKSNTQTSTHRAESSPTESTKSEGNRSILFWFIVVNCCTKTAALRGSHHQTLDTFEVSSRLGKSHWVLVVMDQYSRRIIGFGVHQGDIDGLAVCRMFNRAISGSDPPRHLSTDNDPLFRFHRWQANLRILEVEEIKSVPYVPMSHPFIERLIGTIRREYLDFVPFWNSLDLERKLCEFKNSYNNHRTHSALNGQSPMKYCQQASETFANTKNYDWQEHCHGLFYTPVAA